MSVEQLLTRKNAKRALTAVGAVAVIAGSLEAISQFKSGPEHAKRQEAQESIDGYVPKIVVLHDGSTLRFSPRTENPTSDVDPSNIVGTVKGNELIRGYEVSSKHPGWISFVPKDRVEKIHSFNERADEAVWVNYDALNADGHATMLPTKDIVNPLGKADRGVLPLEITQDGGLVSGKARLNAHANAVSTPMSDEQLNALQFVLDPK